MTEPPDNDKEIDNLSENDSQKPKRRYKWYDRVLPGITKWSLAGTAYGVFNAIITNRPKVFTPVVHGAQWLFLSSIFYTSRELLYVKELNKSEEEDRIAPPLKTTAIPATIVGAIHCSTLFRNKISYIAGGMAVYTAVATGLHAGYIGLHKVSKFMVNLYVKSADTSLKGELNFDDLELHKRPSRPPKQAKTEKPENPHKWWHNIIPVGVLTEEERAKLLQLQLGILTTQEEIDNITSRLYETRHLRKLYEQELERRNVQYRPKADDTQTTSS